MTLSERIKLVKDEEFNWDWENNQVGYTTKTPNSSWGYPAKFDPFPCYHHDIKLVEETAKYVESLFPIEYEVFYFIYPLECSTRTNGSATTNTIKYKDGENKKVWDGVIQLSGKRICIHPAMTRYLISHEYGHIVDYYICACRGLEDNGLDEEYAKMRGIDCIRSYGGRKWHTNIGEIMVNDFRITVCDIETEFWPHSEVACHPNENPRVKEFWQEMVETYGYKK